MSNLTDKNYDAKNNSIKTFWSIVSILVFGIFVILCINKYLIYIEQPIEPEKVEQPIEPEIQKDVNYVKIEEQLVADKIKSNFEHDVVKFNNEIKRYKLIIELNKIKAVARNLEYNERKKRIKIKIRT